MTAQKTYYFINTVFFIANLMTYSGLILFWLTSVRKRLLPTRVRTNMLISGTTMLLFLLVRAMKYRIGIWSLRCRGYAGISIMCRSS